jgi:NAD(P)-dependent dehydrogenase (short-subunit alcohol dehydrogenase family)
MTPHAGRTALVTGGGRGIGRAICVRLAQNGADIAVNYRRDKDSADAVVEEIRGLGRKAHSYQASVDKWDDCASMTETVLADFGHVDVLVNNAGILSSGKSVADTDIAELHRVVATLAYGPFYLSKLLVPQMRALPRGDVIFISSTVTDTLPKNTSPYNMAKVAVDGLAWTLAKEELEHGTHVNIVAPALVATDMGDRLTKAKTSGGAQRASDLDHGQPFGRVCRPDDVADVVDYLVGPRASYLSAQKIFVNGGGSGAFS